MGKPIVASLCVSDRYWLCWGQFRYGWDLVPFFVGLLIGSCVANACFACHVFNLSLYSACAACLYTSALVLPRSTNVVCMCRICLRPLRWNTSSLERCRWRRATDSSPYKALEVSTALNTCTLNDMEHCALRRNGWSFLSTR